MHHRAVIAMALFVCTPRTGMSQSPPIADLEKTGLAEVKNSVPWAYIHSEKEIKTQTQEPTFVLLSGPGCGNCRLIKENMRLKKTERGKYFYWEAEYGDDQLRWLAKKDRELARMANMYPICVVWNRSGWKGTKGLTPCTEMIKQLNGWIDK